MPRAAFDRCVDVTALDGTRLGVQVAGRRRNRHPDLVLVNGLGGTFGAWVHLVEHFRRRHRIVSWDYRGLYASGPPPDPDAVRIEDHVADLLAVLDAVGAHRPVLIGWSMGVQVAVEAALARPDRVSALIAVCGSPGNPHTTVLGWAPMRAIVPVAAAAVERAHRPFGAALRTLVRLPAPEVLRALGVVAPACDLEVFRALSREFAALDWAIYMRTMRRMGEHDAWPRLGGVRVPTLVIGGTKDRLTPPAVAAAMAAAIPGARLVLLDGATHYAPTEYPAEINAAIEALLADLRDSPPCGRTPSGTATARPRSSSPSSAPAGSSG